MSDYVWDHYNKTPPMSTYLVAFMVTDFQSYQINVTGRPFYNVFARKDVQNDTMYIGNLIPRIVRLMQNLTGFHYDLDKLDMIAVPSLAYSAMENWGLITFRYMHVYIYKVYVCVRVRAYIYVYVYIRGNNVQEVTKSMESNE